MNRQYRSLGALALALALWPAGRAAAVPPPVMVYGPYPYATAYQPSSVAIGDLDADGKLDLVSANAGAASISVLLGNGDGTFRPRTDFAVGATPLAVAVADLDADGRLDVVTANSGAASVSVLRGNGDGTFGGRQDLAVGTTPRSVAIVDLDGDLVPDLVVVNSGSNTISMLRGLGSHQFAAARDDSTGAQPFFVAVGDLDVDGHPDLAVSNHGAATVSVMLNAGDGSFEPRADWQSGNGVCGVAIGDLNADGRPDLVCVNDWDCTTAVRLGDGAGGFSPRSISWPGCYGHATAIADMNADNCPDVATVVESGELTVLPGLGNGGLGNRTNCAIGGQSPVALAIADLNGDLGPDVVAACRGSSRLAVYLNGSPYGLPLSAILVSGPNPCYYADPVWFTAYVTPDSATGVIEFRDGDSLIVTAPIDAFGMARASPVTFLAGTHAITGRHPADGPYPEHVSQVLLQQVYRGYTSVRVASSENPSPWSRPVRFDATVMASRTEQGIPEGTVLFQVGADSLGPAVPLVAGKASSQLVDTLSLGEHLVIATYRPADTLRFDWNAGGLYQQVVPPVPTAVEPGSPALSFGVSAVNPASAKQLQLWVRSPDRRRVPVELLDVSGRHVGSSDLDVSPGERGYPLAGATGLAPGLYLLRVGGDSPLTIKVAVLAR